MTYDISVRAMTKVEGKFPEGSKVLVVVQGDFASW